MTVRKVKKKTDAPVEIVDAELAELMPMPLENFDEFFDGDENVKLQLFRLFPKEFDGVPTAGFIDYLTAGDDFGTVAEKYGGGKYKIAKVVKGRFAQQNIFTIAGNPKISPVEGRTDAPGISPHVSGVSVPFISDEVHRDIPIGGTENEFMERILRIKMLNQAFPEKTDINDTLLSVIMSNMSKPSGLGGVISEARDLMGIIQELKSENDDSSGSLNWGSMLKTALEVFTKKKAEVPGPASPETEVYGVPDQISTGADIQDGHAEFEGQDMISIVLDRCTNAICESYFLPTKLPAEQCVAVIKEFIPGSGEELKMKIRDNATLIKNICRMKFRGYYDEDFERRADDNTPYAIEAEFVEFDKYYDEVFALLTDIQKGGSDGSGK
jgi:hypothetical protein